MKVGRTFYFDASHHLPDYNGKCEQLHGHTYQLNVVAKGDVRDDGMVMDFNKLKRIVSDKVLEKLDHMDLNKVLPNPTAENILEWIWTQLEGDLNLHSIKLYEGNDKWVKKTK